MKTSHLYAIGGLVVLMAVAAFVIGAAIGMSRNSSEPVADASDSPATSQDSDRDPEPGATALVEDQPSRPVGNAALQGGNRAATGNTDDDNDADRATSAGNPPEAVDTVPEPADVMPNDSAAAETGVGEPGGNASAGGQNGPPMPQPPAQPAVVMGEGSDPEVVFGKQVVERLSGTVIKVSDGDTVDLELDGGETIRVQLDSIDAPEWRQDYGDKAHQALRRLLFEKQVVVFKTGEDSFDRTIGYVVIDGTNASAYMIENGHAWHYTRFSSDTRLAELQRNAESETLGLWAAEEKPVAPWTWRRDNPR